MSIQSDVSNALFEYVKGIKKPRPFDDLEGTEAQAEADLKAIYRQDAAKKAGIPLEYAERIRGNTPEEMAADAEVFADLLGVERWTAPLGNPDSFIPGPGFGDQMRDIMRRADGSGWARLTDGELNDLFGKVKR